LAEHRGMLLAGFLSPVIAGVVFMVYAGAPQTYILSNIGAALIVTISFWRPAKISRKSSLLAISIGLPCLLGWTFAGPAVGDVHRWIGAGPLMVHAAMLAFPFMATQMIRHDKRIVSAVLALSALIVALQPDRASAFALFFISLCWLYYRQDRWSLITLIIAVAATGVTLLKPDVVPPVRFVENVIGDAAFVHTGLGAVLITAMLLAIAGPIYAARGVKDRPDWSLIAWSACLFGYFLASLVGPYPTPLLGYGVSPILGFGLALAVFKPNADAMA
jgi:hypothetical protein